MTTWRERWYRFMLSHSFSLAVDGVVLLLLWAYGVDFGGVWFWVIIGPCVLVTLFGFAYDVVLILQGKDPRKIRSQVARLMAKGVEPEHGSSV